jgi:tryptophanyl-tRNA synthetase
MKLEIHHFHHADDALIQLLQQMETKIMAALDDLQAAVTAEDTVIDSAITLLQGLAAALLAAGSDPGKLAALQSDIVTKTAALSAAVAANTPSAPATP